jgi:hypothetical protein
MLPQKITVKDLNPHPDIVKNHLYFTNRFGGKYEEDITSLDGAYINVISREAFKEIEGMDERFRGMDY